MVFQLLRHVGLSVAKSQKSISLQPCGIQHTRLPCPSLSPGVFANSCSSSWWCHPTISSSVIPFSSCLQSFPASLSFQMSWLFASGVQSIGASASASALPVNIDGCLQPLPPYNSRTFSSPKRNTAPINSYSLFPSFSRPWKQLTVTMDLLILDIRYKLHHTTCDHLCLPSHT